MRTDNTWIQVLRWGVAVVMYLWAFWSFRLAVFNFSPDTREWNSITGYGGVPSPSEERGWFFLLLTVVCILSANVLLWALRTKKVVWPRRLTRRPSRLTAGGA